MFDFMYSFFAPLTVLSGLYIIMHTLFSIVTVSFVIISTDARFTCEGVNSKHVKNICLVNYERSSISVSNTLYWIIIGVPFVSYLVFSIFISAKEKRVKKTKKCKFHIYGYHFLRVAVHFLFHFLVGIILIFLFKDSKIKLTMDGTFTCVTSNSTFSCLDGHFSKRKFLSISLIVYAVLSFLLTLAEIIYCPYKWKRRNWKEERGNGGDWSAESSGCPDCEYFIMKFKTFPGFGKPGDNEEYINLVSAEKTELVRDLRDDVRKELIKKLHGHIIAHKNMLNIADKLRLESSDVIQTLSGNCHRLFFNQLLQDKPELSLQNILDILAEKKLDRKDIQQKCKMNKDKLTNWDSGIGDLNEVEWNQILQNVADELMDPRKKYWKHLGPKVDGSLYLYYKLNKLEKEWMRGRSRAELFIDYLISHDVKVEALVAALKELDFKKKDEMVTLLERYVPQAAGPSNIV